MSPALRPLLVTGPARSGTTLVARMLSANGDVEIASDPLMPFVKLARSVFCRACRPSIDARLPLLDGYGSAERRVWLDAELMGDLGAPVASEEWDEIRPRLGPRCEIESPDLVGLVAHLGGPTLAAGLGDFLDGVARIRRCPEGSVVGLKELWAVGLVPAMLRHWPGAKALLVRRDPRAVLASNLAMGRHDPAQVAHPLSVLRHWRKQEAIAAWMASRDEFAARVLIVDYEKLVEAPAEQLARVCAFLEVATDDGMIDPKRVVDATGKPFVANTSFEAKEAGVAPELAQRWRTSLDAPRIALTELVCGAEMAAAGYETYGPDEGAHGDPGLLSTLIDDHSRAWSWRSDLGDATGDLEFELTRRELVTAAPGGLTAEVESRLFLFPEARRALTQPVGDPHIRSTCV